MVTRQLLENYRKFVADFFNFSNYFSEGADMTMQFGEAWGVYCLGFIEVQIRFVFDGSFVFVTFS